MDKHHGLVGADPGRIRVLRNDAQGVRPVRGTPDPTVRHQPGGHTIDQIRVGELSFTVDGGTAPTVSRNARQALRKCSAIHVPAFPYEGRACSLRESALP